MASPKGRTDPATPESAKLRDRDSKNSIPTPTQPHKDRIDSILHGARARRLNMDSESDSATGSSPGAGSRAHILRDSEGLKGKLSGESSADEETGIIRRASRRDGGMNYQGTAIATNSGGGENGSGNGGGGGGGGGGGTEQKKKRKNLKMRPTTSSIRRTGRIYHAEDEQIEGREGEDEDEEHESWWSKILSEYGSIELENKGSVARDHLALERTFLSWLRTSLAFASIGIAITQLFRLNTTSSNSSAGDPYRHLRQMGKPLGATFLGISILMLSVGFHRYFESQHWIIRGKFPASRGSIALVAAITFALMITSLVVVVVVEPRAYEKR